MWVNNYLKNEFWTHLMSNFSVVSNNVDGSSTFLFKTKKMFNVTELCLLINKNDFITLIQCNLSNF